MKRALLACLLVLLSAGPAAASEEQESILQDDPLFVYPRSDGELEQGFKTLRELGVDRLRVSVFWNLVAPRPRGKRKPSFGPKGSAWPDSYPDGVWDRYDRIALLGAEYDIELLFTIVGPAPNWAAQRHGGPYSVYKPDVDEFRRFATAVGRRYSGTWTIEGQAAAQSQSQPAPPATPPGVGGTLLPGQPQQPQQPQQQPQQQSTTQPITVPRVDHWSLWNEGNYPTWLSPQSRRTRLPGYRGGYLPYSPHLYRQLADAAFDGLAATGHRSDVILIGETAPRGGEVGVNKTIAPLPFLRELYCVDDRYRRFRGIEAQARGCPVTAAQRRRFRAQNPALFETSGWAHHPYSLDQPPTWSHPSKNSVPLGSIGRIIRAYDRARLSWNDFGQGDIWITEYGYQTEPDPYVGIPMFRQALWTTWAEFIAYGNPRIASMAQFLLHDDRPDTKFAAADIRRWRTWQSGLATNAGARKPLYDEYPFPIHVAPTRPRAGATIRVFSIARPAPDDTPLQARVQEIGPDGRVVTLRRVEVDNFKNYLDTWVRPRQSSSQIRVVWVHASGGTVSTRRVGVEVE